MLGTDKEPGIYVRTLNDLFRAIEETSDDMLYSVSMSYLEVGNFPANRLQMFVLITNTESSSDHTPVTGLHVIASKSLEISADIYLCF